MAVGYEDRLVVFIDILGFKDHLRATVDKDGNDSIEKIKELINAYDLIREHLISNSKGIRQKHITIFSDCIVVSLKPEKDNVIRIFKIISQLIVLLLKKKILCRGGMSFGKIIHKNEYIFGPALVEAHILEEKVANYPRVILHDSVLNEVHNNSDVHKRSIIDSYLVKDFDGYYYFDYINKSIRKSKKDYSSSYLEILSLLHKLVSDNFNYFLKPEQIAIRAKYNWINSKLLLQLQEMYSDTDAPSNSELSKYGLSSVVVDSRVPDLKSKNEFSTGGIFSKRVNYKPFEYPGIYQFTDAINKSFWLPDEIDFDAKPIVLRSKSKYHK